MGKIVMAEIKIAVYGDYDGNAPDTDNLVICDTEDEANKIIADLDLILLSEAKDEKNEEAKLARRRLEKIDVCVPFVDGWQHSLTFKTHEVLIQIDKEPTYDELLKENAELQRSLGELEV